MWFCGNFIKRTGFSELIIPRGAAGFFHAKMLAMVHLDLTLLSVSVAPGGFLPPEEVKERFDSNCITPVSGVALYPAIGRG